VRVPRTLKLAIHKPFVHLSRRAREHVCKRTVGPLAELVQDDPEPRRRRDFGRLDE
jgi:hypothetical protein